MGRGTFVNERERETLISSLVQHGSASLVAPFAAGLPTAGQGPPRCGEARVRTDIAHTALIATSRCDAAARCRTFVDERRIVVSDAQPHVWRFFRVREGRDGL